MPIYEYQCPACGVVEAIQNFSDKPLTKCPECKKHRVKKLISESSFHLKGSGWYATDYGKGGSKKNGAGGNGDKHHEPKPDACSTDAKTETKTETKTDTASKSSEAHTST